MIKAIIVLLNLAFKCWVVNEARSIRLVQAGTQANQLATQLIACFNFCVCLKKGVSGKHPIRDIQYIRIFH